jgi:pimeloyl-ACP methyl ester carboxylesterase
LSTTPLLVVALLGVAAGWALFLLVPSTGGRIGAGVLALVAIGIGGGIGLPYAAKGGGSVTTIVACAVLAAGVALLVASAIALAHDVHGWSRLGVVVAAVAVSYLVLSTIGVAVAATNVPHASLGDATPADYGLDYRDVTFPATDGVELSGWYVPSEHGDAVVLLHGAGSTRSAVLDHAAVLARAGYGVLLFDARGHGESSGRAMDFGWYGDRDVNGAVQFLARQSDVGNGRILAVGMSMGGEEAIGAAASNPRICGVVAEGATGRTAADRAWLSGAYGVRGFGQEALDRLRYGLVDLLTPASPPPSLRHAVEAMAPRRVLLIAARRVTSEPHAADHIEGGSPRTVDVWIAPGAGHTNALEARQSEWIDRVTEFLAAARC